MTKITLLGAGSGFTQPLFTDILNIEGLTEGVIGLVDINKARLDINTKLIKRILSLLNKTKWRVEASTDRKKILPGTNYLISTIEVSGIDCVRYDNDIPLKYGIDQCIGDTVGPGGVMKALRTLPTFLAILEDAKKYCPNALIMNYTNPMSIMTLGAVRTTDQPFVGLCHSVQGNSRQIADILEVPYEELEWQCGGINHMAWFTRLKWNGKDMHAKLRAAAEREDVILEFPIRTDLVKNLGYFSTEGCGHYSEYVPYYRKRKDLLKTHGLDRKPFSTGYYADHWPLWRKETDNHRREMAEGKREIPLKHGYEYASDIIEAHVFDRKKIIYASIKNTGLIPNLPETGVVEVATLVDRQGFTPTYFGNLPEQCAALCRSNMAVFELCVDGILKQNRESIIHAMMLDPLSAAVASLPEIRSMAEELFVAEKKFIPSWCAKPKTVAFVREFKPITSYVRTAHISKVLPHKPLDSVSYPKKSSLDLHKHTFTTTFMNRHDELKKEGSALVYYFSRIKCSSSMELIVHLGYDGPVKMWIDGKEMFYDPKGTNPACNDIAKINFTASKGEHEIAVVLDSNGGNAWGIYLRFERKDVKKSKTQKGYSPFSLPLILDVNYGGGVADVSSMSAQRAGTRKKG